MKQTKAFMEDTFQWETGKKTKQQTNKYTLICQALWRQVKQGKDNNRMWAFFGVYVCAVLRRLIRENEDVKEQVM